MSTRSPKKRRQSHKFLYDDVSLKQQLRAVPKAVSGIGITNPGIVQFLNVEIERFLKRYASAHSHMQSPKAISEFVDGSKRRYRDLQLLVQSAITADDAGLALLVQRRTSDGTVRTFKYKYESRMEIINADDDDDVVYLNQIQPKAYTPLFKAAYCLISELQGLDREYESNLREEIRRGLLILLSVGKIYDNLRGSDDYILSKINESILHMTTVPSLGPDYSQISATMAEIRSLVETGDRPPRYLRDITNAIRGVRMDEYDPEEDAYISFRSSGTSWRNPETGRYETIPALFAALVEKPIELPEQSLIGYTPTSVQPELPIDLKIRSRGPHTKAIPQSKISPRIIQLAPNQLQDIANWFHNRLDSVNRRLPSDCTHDQERGVAFLRNALSSSRNGEDDMSVYTEDISDATGTINPQFQRDALAMVFGDQLADLYMKLANAYPKIFVTPKGDVRYQQTNGQPQGYKGSFPAFALCHHILFLTVMRLMEMYHMDPSRVYRVLGDDSAATAHDPDYAFRDAYVSLCASIGWTVNDKGYEYNPYDPTTKPIAEFAKVTIIGGEVFTPIPLKTLLNVGESVTRVIQFYNWIALRVRPVSFQEVLNALRDCKAPKGINMEDFLAFLKQVREVDLSPTLSAFTVEETEMDLHTMVVTSLSILKSEVRASLYGEFLPDHLREDAIEDPKTLDPTLCEVYEKYLVPLCTDQNNKFFWCRRKNQVIIDALNEIFDPETPGIGLAAMALGITQEQYSQVYLVTDVLSTDPTAYDTEEALETIINAIDAWRSLTEGKTLRSWAKQKHREAVLLLGAYKDSLSVWQSTGWYEPSWTAGPDDCS